MMDRIRALLFALFLGVSVPLVAACAPPHNAAPAPVITQINQADHCVDKGEPGFDPALFNRCAVWVNTKAAWNYPALTRWRGSWQMFLWDFARNGAQIEYDSAR